MGNYNPVNPAKLLEIPVRAIPVQHFSGHELYLAIPKNVSKTGAFIAEDESNIVQPSDLEYHSWWNPFLRDDSQKPPSQIYMWMDQLKASRVSTRVKDLVALGITRIRGIPLVLEQLAQNAEQRQALLELGLVF